MDNKTSGTPYDDAFRTMMQKSGSLRIPFINEVLSLSVPIPPDAEIENLHNEFFIDEGSGKQRKIITDAVFRINGKTYHIECQSTDDGTILIRMFEYDFITGLSEGEYTDYHLTVRIPTSGVLFLRKTAKTPKQMSVTIETRAGSIEYPVDVLSLADYTLDDLIRKNLLFLFPFYMFNLESEFAGYEREEEGPREKVVTSLDGLIEHVNGLYNNEKLSVEHYLLITDMLKKVTDSLTQKYEHVRKELDNIMGGKVLEFKGEKLINQGRAEGKIEELLGLVYDGAITEEYAADRAEKRYGVKKEDFQKMLKNYVPDNQLMQG